MKTTIRMLPLLLLCLISKASGCYVGNPAAPAALKLGLFNNTPSFFNLSSSYLYDEESNKYFVNNAPSPDLQKVDKVSIRSQFGGITLNLLERLELFGLLGSSKAGIDWGESSELEVNPAFFKNGTTDKHFSWMAGVRAIFLQWGQVYLGAGFSYFDIPTLKSGSTFIDAIRERMDIGPQYFKLREWQGDVGLAIRLGPLMPYAGGQYLHSRLKIIASDEGQNVSYNNRDTLGVFAGVSLAIGKKILINAEWRDFTEKALSLEASFAF